MTFSSPGNRTALSAKSRTSTSAQALAPLQALGVGPWQGPEFTKAWTDISSGNEWLLVADIDEACDTLADNQEPSDLVFLAQSLPGQYLQADVDRLQKKAPLARIVLVVGTWSEGELRTGAPPSGVVRLYWYELQAWWQTAIRRFGVSLPPLWSSPLNQHHAGRWSNESSLSPFKGPALSVLIAAADYSVYETLAAVIYEHGIKSTWKGQDPAALAATSANAGIWDGGQLSENELVGLTHFCQQINGPVIALLDFPRVEHAQQTQAAGATALFAKPYVVEELVAAISGNE